MSDLPAVDRSRVRQFDRAFGAIDWYIGLGRLFEEEMIPFDIFGENTRMETARRIDHLNDLGYWRRRQIA